MLQIKKLLLVIITCRNTMIIIFQALVIQILIIKFYTFKFIYFLCKIHNKKNKVFISSVDIYT